MIVHEPASMAIGAEAIWQRTVTEADVAIFALITDAIHPLHLDPGYAASTHYARPLIPTALVAGLCTVAIFQVFPGLHVFPTAQQMGFHAHAFVADTLIFTVTVTASQGDRYTCALVARRDDGELIASGTLDIQTEILPDLPDILD